MFQPQPVADSLLRRFDARFKLLLTPLWIATVFALREPQALFLMGCWALMLLSLAQVAVRDGLRLLWLFRWLFLFTLLLHLLFTPGRTLLGTTLLSYDGLLVGARVSVQLALALLFASLLNWTTTPASLAGALGRLLAPLRRVGLPVTGIGEFLLLVLHFLPQVQREMAQLAAPAPSGRAAPLGRGAGAALLVGERVAPWLGGLLDQADALAQRLVRGETLEDEAAPVVAPLHPLQTLLLAAVALLLPLVAVMLQP